MKLLHGWLILSLCALPACTWQWAPEARPPVLPAAMPKPTALSAEAASVLQAAEQSVIDARAKQALWSAAVMQLELARAAAREFDSEATLRHAREVIALCVLSVQQMSAPPVKW